MIFAFYLCIFPEREPNLLNTLLVQGGLKDCISDFLLRVSEWKVYERLGELYDSKLLCCCWLGMQTSMLSYLQLLHVFISFVALTTLKLLSRIMRDTLVFGVMVE